MKKILHSLHEPPIVALEIGTSKVRAVVGEAAEDGHIMVTGVGECPSRGVRKGEIVDFDNAMACVRSALQLAEESGQVIINQVHLLVSGDHVKSLVNRGSVPILSRNHEITQDDVADVMENARVVNLPADRQVLHTICQQFFVDDQEGVIKPQGLEGSRLAVDMLVLHGVLGRLRNLVKVVRSVQLDVEDVAFSGLCAALAVLAPEEKGGGVALIDLGGGTTDYVVYAHGVIALAGVYGVGGDHVSNDLARGLRLPLPEAERLKEEHGSAVLDPLARNQKIVIPAEPGQPERTVKLADLQTVVSMRMLETFDLVKEQLQKQNLLHALGGGIVLTGGGAHLKNVVRLAEKVFGLPCRIGKPRNFAGLAAATEQPEYAAALGMMRYGFRMVRKRGAGSSFTGLLKSLIGK